MNIFRAACCCMLLLTGCAQTETHSEFSRIPSADNYRFLQKEYETLAPNVEFVLLKNNAEYVAAKKEAVGNRWRNVSAFTYWNMQTATCKIFIKDPAWSYEPEYIGHEVAHCIWGRFHKGAQGLGTVINSSPWGE